jgi:putative heme transporter
VPRPLVVAADWAWRILVVVAAAALLVAALRVTSVVVVPLAVAVLLASLLTPPTRALTRRTPLPRSMSALVTLLAMVVVVGGLFSLAVTQLAGGASDMRDSAEEGVRQVTDWLRTGPLGLSSAELADYIDRAQQSLRGNSGVLTTGLLSAGTTAGHFLAGLLICLIATYFFLSEGDRMWSFLVRMLPHPAQDPTHEAFRRGWVSLGHYARTQVLVAAVDAIGIGLGALVLGLPFVVPLTLLVFLSSFIPIVGAVFSGAVAVLVALVVEGPGTALLMLAIVLLVQQVETHVLQPFLMGRAVALHPLAVITSVAIGSFLLGVVGALFAVPVLALVNSVVRYYVGHDTVPELTSASAEDPRDTDLAGPDVRPTG